MEEDGRFLGVFQRGVKATRLILGPQHGDVRASGEGLGSLFDMPSLDPRGYSHSRSPLNHPHPNQLEKKSKPPQAKTKTKTERHPYLSLIFE